jgi:hypothetical protein
MAGDVQLAVCGLALVGGRGFCQPQDGGRTLAGDFCSHAFGGGGVFAGRVFFHDAHIDPHGDGSAFPDMQRKHGGSLLKSLGWTFASVLLALGAFLLTLPMWLVPPLAMLLPALIWGWLTYRVMVFDVLADFASVQERQTLMARHRMSWLSMGVITGLMGAAPSLVWASGALFAAAFVILVPVAIWIYTLVFVFSSLWFAHYALAALQALRHEPVQASVGEVLPAVPLHASARLGLDSDDVTDVNPRRIP